MTLVICCSGVVLCVDRCKFASWCCEPHCNGCMMLHGLCFGEEAGARNLVFFRVKWLQATMKAASCVRRVRLRSVCRFFFCRSVTVASSCFGCACVCIVIGCFGICACRSHWNGCMTVVIWCSGVVLCVDRCKFASWCCEPHCNGCMMLHGLCFGEEAGARNLVFFRVKWLQATMKGTSCVRRVRLRSVCRFFCRSVTVAWSCFRCACVCVVIGCFGICACRSHWNGCMTVVIWCSGVVLCVDRCKFANRIVMAAWCCMGYVLGRKPEHETLCFSV